MANTYFQFKQFTVHQAHSAMKVCTDACLFGAWLAKDTAINNGENILDIGTGTGLLSLMVAQSIFADKKSFGANITAVEIELAAAGEAKSNFESSPWKQNLNVVHSPIQTFCKFENELESPNPSEKTYDCIISNPPFFEGDLHSPIANKNIALHSTALPWQELINEVVRLLKQDGYYYVLIPAIRSYTMQKLAAQHNLKLLEEVVVFNAEKQKPFRVIQKFKSTLENAAEIKRSNFIIKDKENKYTENFSKLLSPYYLHL